MAGKNIHLIIGEDDYLVRQETKKILSAFSDKPVIIDSVLSSNAEAQLRDMKAVEEESYTSSMFEPTKAIWWKNVRFLPAGGKKASGDEEEEGERASKEVLERLKEFAVKLGKTKLPEEHCLVISAPKVNKASKFYKAISVAAECHVHETPDEKKRDAVAVTMAREHAKEAGLDFVAGADIVFARKVGVDTQSVVNEIAKLSAYLGEEKTITIEAINAITSAGIGQEPAIWSVSNAIASRNVAEAIAVLSHFEGESGYEIMMTIMLEKCFRELEAIKAAEEEGCVSEATAGMNPWRVSALRRNLENWKLQELRMARAHFAALRERVVSGSKCGADLIVVEMLRICRRKTPQKSLSWRLQA